MKKITSILLLLLFGVYSFTFKTHYCFYPTGERFHGDCQEHIHEAETKGELGSTNLFPQKYFCEDIVKNTQVQETKIVSVKSPISDLIFIPPVAEIIAPVFSVYHLPQPEPKCRSATIISVHTLRGPPLV